MTQLNGCIIAESLADPTVINQFPVYRAYIGSDDQKVGEHGETGRWHLYWVHCARADIDTVQRVLKRGWYAHFWHGDHVTVIYADQAFEISANDRSTWAAAVAHGRDHGIPDEQLDFLTV